MDNKNKWLVLIIFAFLLNGIPGIMAKSVVMNNVLSKYWYILFFYIGGLLLSLFFIIKSQKLKLSDLIIGMLAGAFSFFGILFLILSLEQLQAFVVFPISNGGVIFVTAMFSYFIFKEKLSNKELAGIILGFIAIVLFSLA